MRNRSAAEREGTVRLSRKNATTPAQFREQTQDIIDLLHREGPRLTFQQIGNSVGLTRQRIQQINAKLKNHGRRKREPRRVLLDKRRKEREMSFIPARDAFVEYRAYVAAKARCTNPNHPSFKDYGGRGVEFRFTSFMEMFEEIGHRPEVFHPSGKPLYSLNRIDNTGHYEPGNVEWATQERQCAVGNRRKAKVKSLTIVPK